MWIIVDNDISVDFFIQKKETDYAPVYKWLNAGKGKIVYGGKNRDELVQHADVASELIDLDQAGRAYYEKDSRLLSLIESLLCSNSDYKCNDCHVLALARLSGCRILCSNDKALCGDFGKRALLGDSRGRVYKNNSHRDLLYKKNNHSSRKPNYL